MVLGSNPSDMALAILAFKNLKQASGGRYDVDIDRILRKILVSQESEAFDLLFDGLHEVSPVENRPMCSESIHIGLITIAVELRKGISVTLVGDANNRKSTIIQQPSLHYHNGCTC